MRDVMTVILAGRRRPVEMDGWEARRLIARGLATPYPPPVPALVRTATASPPETAMQPRPRGGLR